MRRQFSVYVVPSVRGRKITIAGKRLRTGSRGYVARKRQRFGRGWERERERERTSEGENRRRSDGDGKRRVARVYAYTLLDREKEREGERENERERKRERERRGYLEEEKGEEQGDEGGREMGLERGEGKRADNDPAGTTSNHPHRECVWREAEGETEKRGGERHATGNRKQSEREREREREREGKREGEEGGCYRVHVGGCSGPEKGWESGVPHAYWSVISWSPQTGAPRLDTHAELLTAERSFD